MARTWCLLSNNSTLSIWPTRRRLTRIRRWSVLNDFNLTSYERITSISLRTGANWTMISNLTLGIDATCSRTRIDTFLIVASFILWTFWACDTLWSTSWRSTNISEDTWANSLTIDLSTLGVWSTRRRLTRIGFNRGWRTNMHKLTTMQMTKSFWIHTMIRSTLNKCISTHARRTRTHWYVINHITNSILSTRSRAWIDTFISNTRLITRAVIVYDTFRSTNWIWISLILGQALAYSIQTLSIWTTWWRIARIIMRGFFR